MSKYACHKNLLGMPAVAGVQRVGINRFALFPLAIELAPGLPKRRVAEYAETAGHPRHSPLLPADPGCPDSILASAIEQVGFNYENSREKFHVFR
jgi:hypothetical protein